METIAGKKLNRTALVCWTIIMSILGAAYILEIVKGLRTIPYILILMGFGIIPLIIAWILYVKNCASKVIPFIMIFGYSAFFAYVLFESPFALTVVYIFPVMAVLLMYGDVKLAITSACIAVAIVIARIGYSIWLGHLESTDITDYELQFFSTFLIGIFSVLSVRGISFVNSLQMKQIEKEMKHSERVNQKILKTGKEINVSVGQIQETIGHQQKNAVKTTESLMELAAGVQEVAASLSSQSEITQVIQNSVNHIADSTTEMAKHSQNTKLLVDESSRKMESAKEQSDYMKKISQDITKKLEQLSEKTNSMENILLMIGEVSDNTNLLSLNASIEAARAGEIGKGFAVVADEIRSLADTTKDSAMEIEGLLRSFRELSEEVQQGIGGMIIGVDEQHESIESTYQGFSSMVEALDKLDESANRISDEMEELKASNQTIVEAVSGMSAASEQISANSRIVETLSDETCQAGEVTSEQIVKIAGQVQRLIQAE